MKISEKFRFFRKFRTSFDLVKFSKNFDFGQNFRKFSISFRKFGNISMKVKFSNFDLGQIFEKFSFWSNFRKNFHSILVKSFENFVKFRFWSCFWKISILVKFSKIFDFGQIFQKISILVKIFENFENFRF